MTYNQECEIRFLIKIFLMARKIRYPKISKIFAIGIIVMLVTGCDLDDPDNPDQFSDLFDIKELQNGRRERLLKKLLIETQETNALLKNIERLLELDKGTKNAIQEELSG